MQQTLASAAGTARRYFSRPSPLRYERRTMLTMPPYVSFASPKRWTVERGGAVGWRLWRLGFRRWLIGPHAAAFWRPLSFEQMGSLAISLRDLGVAFSAGREWCPSEVVLDLRDRGLFDGSFTEIYWNSEGWHLREL